MANILVVDDEDRMRKLIKKILSKKHSVSGEAKNGKEALEKLEEIDPDVITLDIQMPKVDGLEVLSTVKEESDSIKVVIVSVVSPNDEEMDDLQKKADAHVVKPARKKELLDAIEGILIEKEEDQD